MKATYLDMEGRHSARIDVDGQFAVHESEEIRQEMKTVYAKDIFHVLFDLSKCDFIDSTGLGMLVSVHKHCSEHNGKVVLYKPTEQVQSLLAMTRLDQVFEVSQ